MAAPNGDRFVARKPPEVALLRVTRAWRNGRLFSVLPLRRPLVGEKK